MYHSVMEITMLSKFNDLLNQHTEEILQAFNEQEKIRIDFQKVMTELEGVEDADEEFVDYLQSLVLNLQESSEEDFNQWLITNLPASIPEECRRSVLISILVDIYEPQSIDKKAVQELIKVIKEDGLDLVSFLDRTTLDSLTVLTILKVAVDNQLVEKTPELKNFVKSHQLGEEGQTLALTTWIGLLNKLGTENVVDQLKTNIGKPHFTLFTAVTTRTTYTEVFQANSLRKVIEAFAEWYIERYHNGDEDVLDLTYSEGEGTLEVTNHSYDDVKTVDGSVEKVSHFAYYLRDWCNHGEEQVDIKITFNKVL